MRKSADALAKNGNTVHVLYAFRTQWATDADGAILHSALWTFERIGGDPYTERLRYFWTRLLRKAFEVIGSIERSLCQGFSAYVQRGVNWEPDLIIGHNPGALGPLVEISKRLNIPALFDAEDFHRGETALQNAATVRVTQLENTLLPQLTHMTAASPMTADAYRNLFPQLSVTTVNNAFPLHYITKEPTTGNEKSLSIVWFSQVIGLDRGLGEFMQCLQFIPNVPISISLLGLASAAVKNEISRLKLSPNHRVQFHQPKPEKELFHFVAQHEIGLALEPGFSLNNELARSNKIYSYPLSGCYTLASKTKAQIQFFEEFPKAGQLIELGHPESIALVLQGLFDNRLDLLEKRKKAWLLAKTSLNWDRESQRLISLVKNLLVK